MTIEEMKKKKKELGYTYEMISALSGVPAPTVQKILSGVTAAPRFETIRALEKAFQPPGNDSWPMRESSPFQRNDNTWELQESSFVYGSKKQGEYTIDDYYGLPEERRVELIDGVIYDMAAPSPRHQLISTEIWDQLKSYIRGKGGSCIPFVAPLDVQLDMDDRTMVQPDVLIVCNRSKLIRRCLYGAPDFIVEILSDSTKRKDMFVKLSKYRAAGVREYWIVDPDKRKVVVYDLEHNELPVIYGFDDKIPVCIFSGECKIDFAEIYDYIQFLYEDRNHPEED